MFCPEGYIPAVWLWGEITPQLYESLIKSVWEWYENDKATDVGAEFLLQQFMRMTPMDRMDLRILYSIADLCFICSPTGQVLKFDIASILTKASHWDINAGVLKHYLDSEFISRKESEEIISLSQVKCYDYSFYVDKLREDIKEKVVINFAEFARKYGWLYSHQYIPPFFERTGFTINFRAFDLFARNDDPSTYRLAPVLDILRPFEGWAICTKAEYLTDSWRNDLIDLIKNDKDSSPTSNLIGRPRRKRDIAIRLYREIYPHGHGSDSWPVVARKISTHAGDYISTDTIQRAIIEINSAQKVG